MSSNPFAHHHMSSKGVIFEELALVFSIARVLHFSLDHNVPGEDSNLSSHVYPVYDLTNMQVLGGLW